MAFPLMPPSRRNDFKVGYCDTTKEIHRSLIGDNYAFCLNCAPAYNPGSVLGKIGYVESDTDEQMILVVPFHRQVTLTAVSVFAERKGSSRGGPSSIKIFRDAPNLDFDDAEDLQPTAHLHLSEDDVRNFVPKKLKTIEFIGCSGVSIYIEKNHGNHEKSFVMSINFYGVSIHGQNSIPWSPREPKHSVTANLVNAVAAGDTKTVQELVARGVDVNAGAPYTALEEAIRNGHTGIVKYLIANAKCDIERRNPNSGYTPLLMAARYGRVEVMQHLIEKAGASPMAECHRGNTPCMVAAYSGHLEAVKYLVTSCIARLFSIGQMGLTTVEIAEKNVMNNPEISQYITQITTLLKRSRRALRRDVSSLPMLHTHITMCLMSLPEEDENEDEDEVDEVLEGLLVHTRGLDAMAGKRMRHFR